MIKICKLCGKEYEAEGKSYYCPGPHFNTCIVCGKLFEISIDQTDKKTCSRKCSIEYSNILRAKAREAKASMNLDPNQSKGGKYLRTCIVCNEEFRTGSKTRVLCYKPHTRSCVICSKDFPLNVYCPDTQTCSSGCAAELRTRRNLEKYGVRSTLELESTKEKIRQTCLDRYGTENVMSSPIIQDRIKATNMEKFGTEWSVQSKEVQAKSQKTCMERYGVKYGCISEQAKQKTIETNLKRRGVKHVFQDPEFQKQAKQSCLERYGTEHYVQSEDFRSKAEATWMENYGVDNPLKSDEIQRKVEATSMKKFGTRRPQQSEELKSRIRDTNIMNHANKIQDEGARREYLEFKKDPQKYLADYIRSHDNVTPSSLSSRLGFEDTTIILSLLHEYGFEDIASNLSSMESSIVDFIRSLDTSIDILVHDRKVIAPQELDIYLPQYHIGIECDPTTTHNSTISLGQILGASESLPISTDYHKTKSLSCLDNGCFLFHIFGYEWKSKPSVIKSMLRNLLGKCMYKHHARKLQVKEADSISAENFLDQNHRQGSTRSKVHLGLYTLEDELVSLMSFSSTRVSMGHTKSDDDTVWELTRFCSKLNTSVVGGASKLFQYFLKHYDWTKIVSFSDISHTRGTIYDILGFTKIHMSAPGYCWVHLNSDLYLNRVSCQKKNLRKLFNDDSIDIENKTEQQIMVEHGFVQVFDSGTIRWEYTK